MPSINLPTWAAEQQITVDGIKPIPLIWVLCRATNFGKLGAELEGFEVDENEIVDEHGVRIDEEEDPDAYGSRYFDLSEELREEQREALKILFKRACNSLIESLLSDVGTFLSIVKGKDGKSRVAIPGKKRKRTLLLGDIDDELLLVHLLTMQRRWR